MSSINVIGIDHIYVSVTDMRRAEKFYDAVMKLLDFRKGAMPIGGDEHLHYFNRVTQYSIRPARVEQKHDPYQSGLHHLCFRVENNQQVDAVADALSQLDIQCSKPQFYPEYADDYYAVFFEDPDGIRLEVVALRKRRRLIDDAWDRLTEFENSMAKAGLV